MSKPTVESILAQADALVERASGRNRMYDRMDKLYFMSDAKVSTDTVQYVTMPYATSVIDLIADLAATMKVNVSVPAAGVSHTDEEDSEALESWLMEWFKMNGRKQGRVLVGEAAWLAAMRGQCVVRTRYVDKSIRFAQDKDEETTVAGLPVLMQLCDPRNVFVSEGPLGPRCVIEQWERPAADVRALYPNVLDADIDDKQKVKWMEYWDDTHFAYFCDGVGIRRKPFIVDGHVLQPGGVIAKHGYGCLPYSFGKARATAYRDDELRYRPVLLGVENLVETIDTWYSILATAGWASVTNAWAIYSDNYGHQDDRKFDLTAGGLNYFNPGEKVEAIQRAPMPADFFQLGNLLFQAFQTQTFPFALYGQSPGDMAGYAISLLSQAGRRILLPIWRCIEDVFAGAMINCVTICRNKVAPLVGNKIPLVVTEQASPTARRVLRKLRLDVNKYGDDLDVTMALGDPMPADEAGALRMALEATKGRLLSRQTALEKWKLSASPAAEADLIAVEAIYDSIAPIEGVKLAMERGVIPRKIEIPPGFTVGKDGMLIPQALLDAAQGAQQPQGAPPPQAAPMPMPQNAAPMPQEMLQLPSGMMQQGMPAQMGAPQGQPQFDPAMIQQIIAAIQAGMLPMPSGTGQETGQPNIMDLNSLAGQPIEPRLEDMSGGQQPRARMPGGF